MGNVIFNIVDLLLRALRDERNLRKQSINLKKKVKPLGSIELYFKIQILTFYYEKPPMLRMVNGHSLPTNFFNPQPL
jgi:hypothetical protein